MDLPSGTVTFLFTDIEGSTRLWDEQPEAMRLALSRHDAMATSVVGQHAGTLVKSRGEGDSFFAVFPRATDAIATAYALQHAFFAEPWPTPTPLRVRMALHTGEADLRDGDYYGAAVNRCARLRAIAHGGQVLLSLATEVLVREALPEGVRLRDLGLIRLQDLAHPEHVFQLAHPALTGEFPSLRSLDTLPNNLPLQLTSFVGREREIAEVKRLLATTHLLTLTGSGGCGKTRLALQGAAEVAEQFADGVWLVELAALTDAALVPQSVASALGVREESGRSLTATLTEFLRPKSLLLVLDNCEHLLSACAQLAEGLLRACPQLRIVASSREGLGIAGEQTYRVPSLALPGATHLPPPERLQEFEAVQLFGDRARLSQPAFALTAANAPAVVEVCRRLDGIPLAIELAAARVKALPVEQIAKRLDDRFRLLTGGSRTALPRQQTLRALIDWSYDLLSEPERALLRRLSVFAGGCTLAAAETVCVGEGVEEWGVLDLLTSLVEKSLVLYEEQDGDGRYRLLETVRQYARDRLMEAGEAALVRGRHRDWFLTLAAEAQPYGFPGWTASLDLLEREHDNLRAALGWSVAQGEGEAGLRLGNALRLFWNQRGYWTEGREYLTELLALLRPQARTADQADALQTAGRWAWYQGDLGGARMLWEESLTINRELGNQQDIAETLYFFGLMVLNEGEHGEAQALLEESLAIFQALGVNWGMAWALTGLGSVAHAQGRDEAVQRLLEEAWTLDQGNETCMSQGHLLLELGDYATARARYEQGLAQRSAAGRTVFVAWALMELGHAVWLQGEYDVSQSHSLEALAMFQEFGDQEGLLAVLESLAVAALSQGEKVRAARLLGAVEGLRATLGLPGPYWWRRPRERMGEAVRAAALDQVFAVAWAEGRTVSIEDAVRVALEDASP